MAHDYISLEEFKATAELTGFSFADNDARREIASASRGVEEYTGRRFWADTDATSVRYYSPVSPRHIEVDDLVTLGTFQTDDDGDGTFETTWALNTDFVLEPLNAAADGKPYEVVYVHPASGLRVPCWPRSVKVTGQFGWSAVPSQVKTATTILATRLLKRAREAPFGVVNLGSESSAVHVARTDPDVCAQLDPLRRGIGAMIA